MNLNNPTIKNGIIGIIKEASPILPEVGKSLENSVAPSNLTSALDGLAAANRYLINKLPDCKKLRFVFCKPPNRKNIEEFGDFIEKQEDVLAKLTREQAMHYEKGGIQEPINYLAYKITGAYNVDRYVHSRKGYTSGLDDCIGVLIYNENDAYLYHLSPNMHKCDSAIKYMKEKLASRISELTGKTKCRACLVGGKEEYSRPLYGHIKDVLDKNNTKTQEILFNENGHTDIYYDLDKGIFPLFSSGSSLERINRRYAQVQL